jgi:hypothetical protein
MSPIYDTWPTAIYDPEAIRAYLGPSGGYVMPSQVECVVVPHVYASNWSDRPDPRTRLGPAVCEEQCSYAGAESVVLIRDPVAEADQVRVMTMTYDACDFYPVPARRVPAGGGSLAECGATSRRSSTEARGPTRRGRCART